MALTRIDHATSAAARMPGYLRKQRWLELLAALMAEVQEIEDMWLAMLASNAIADAGGDQLDQIGRLVDQPRGGAADVDYRRRILAKVAVNRSLGLVNDIIRIARLVIDDTAVAVEIDQQGVAAYVARLTGAVPDATADDLAGFIGKGTSAGVRSIVESSAVAPASTFQFEATPQVGGGFNNGSRAQITGDSWGGPSTLTVKARVLGTDGNDLTFALFEDPGADPAGEITDDGSGNVVVLFLDSVTTIADVEALLDASRFMYSGGSGDLSTVKTADATPSPVSLAGGTDDGGALAHARE